MFSNYKEKILYSLVSGFFGALLLFIIQQLFFSSNEKTKQQYELQKEILKEQYYFLKQIKYFTEINTRECVLITTFKHTGSNNKVIGIDNEGITMNFPSIVRDTLLQNKSKEIINLIYNNKNNIDVDIFNYFEQIVNYIEKYPFPKNDSIELIIKSFWTEKEIIGKWYSMNYYLSLKVDSMISLKFD